MIKGKNFESIENIWLPFTNMNDFCRNPIVLSKAIGHYVYDNQGNELVDCISSLWHVSVGHGNEFYIKRLEAQLRSNLTTSSLFGAANEVALEYSKRLINFINTPSLQYVFFSSGGSEAVEAALKIAIKYNTIRKKGTKILYLNQAYHGVSLGALSAMGITPDREDYEGSLSKSFIPIDNPYCYRCPFEKSPSECMFECSVSLDNVLNMYGNEIGAIIIEPVQGAGGVIVPPAGYLKKIYEICKKNEILIIFDEVVTGFYRTGNKFAFYEEELVPDILILSKGISGGIMPLGATIVSEEIFSEFGKNNEILLHGNTYSGNPLACAAGLAHLDFIEKDTFLGQLEDVIKSFHERLEKMRSLNIVGDVRYKGLMAGVELVSDKHSKKPLRTKTPLAVMARNHGLFIRPLGNVVTIFPMFIADDLILEQIFNSLENLLIGIITMKRYGGKYGK